MVVDHDGAVVMRTVAGPVCDERPVLVIRVGRNLLGNFISKGELRI